MVQPRPLWASAALILGTIATGLALRMVPLGFPGPLIKHGGSALWALMIFWVVSTARPRWPHMQSALVAIGIAFAVEFFQLYHAPWLDSFRLTLPGALLLGRVFSTLDLLAYASAIAVGAYADRRFRLEDHRSDHATAPPGEANKAAPANPLPSTTSGTASLERQR